MLAVEGVALIDEVGAPMAVVDVVDERRRERTAEGIRCGCAGMGAFSNAYGSDMQVTLYILHPLARKVHTGITLPYFCANFLFENSKAAMSRSTRLHLYPVNRCSRMMPFLKPQLLHILLATARKRLSPDEPYWPCKHTLNISTTKPHQPPPSASVPPSATWSTETDPPGLARTVFAAPALAPTNAISCSEIRGKGEMMLFETPYAAKSSEFTPAMPIRGLAMPARSP